MVDVLFVLKTPVDNEPGLIYFLIHIGTQHQWISTGEKINPKFWDFEKQRAKKTKSFPRHSHINEKLDKLAHAFWKDYQDLVNTKPALTQYEREEALKTSLGVTWNSKTGRFKNGYLTTVIHCVISDVLI